MLITATMMIVEDSSRVNIYENDDEKEEVGPPCWLVSTWGTSGHDQTTKLASVFKFGIQPEYRWWGNATILMLNSEKKTRSKSFDAIDQWVMITLARAANQAGDRGRVVAQTACSKNSSHQALSIPHHQERPQIQMWHLKDIFEQQFLCEIRSRSVTVENDCHRKLYNGSLLSTGGLPEFWLEVAPGPRDLLLLEYYLLCFVSSGW